MDIINMVTSKIEDGSAGEFSLKKITKMFDLPSLEIRRMKR
jgi:hypothetical protein